MTTTNTTAAQMIETMTAREMALTSHRLGRNNTAKTADGRSFVWNATQNRWVRK